MAYDDPLDFESQEQKLLQQAAQIKAMREMGAKPVESPGETGGWSSSTGQRMPGIQLRTPAAAMFTPLVNTVGAQLGENRMNSDRTALNRAEETDAVSRINSMGDSPTNEQIVSAQSNPVLKKVMEAKLADTLVASEARKATYKLEMAKKEADDMRAEKKLINDQFVAYIRSNGGTFTLGYDRAGNPMAMNNRTTELVTPQYGKGQPGTTPAPFKLLGPVADTPQGREFTTAHPVAPQSAVTPTPLAPASPSDAPATPQYSSGIPGVKFVKGMIPLGEGKADEVFVKHNMEVAQTVQNAGNALHILDKLETLSATAETNPAVAGFNAGMSVFNKGKTTSRNDDLRAMKLYSDRLTQYADRKMYGPNFSEKDSDDIKEQMGKLGQAKSHSERATIIGVLREGFTRMRNGDAFSDTTAIPDASSYIEHPTAAPAASPAAAPRAAPTKAWKPPVGWEVR